MADPTLGLIMILKNEAANLERSLAPVARAFDEIVVVDTGSTDGTRRICRGLGARVHPLTWQDDFSHARNYSIEKARADWLFWLDGDNAISARELAELRKMLPATGRGVIWAREKLLPSGDILWQKRCFPNNGQARFMGRVHEQLAHPPGWPQIAAPLTILHWGYADPQAVRDKGAYYLSILHRELGENPGDSYSRFQAARCLVNLRRFGEAQIELAKVAADPGLLDQNPDLFVHAHMLWCDVLEKLRQRELARRVAEGLVRAAPASGLAHYRLGRLAYGHGDWAAAARHLGRAAELGPGTPFLDGNPDKTAFLMDYYRGQALMELDEPGRAAQAFAAAKAKDPGNLAARSSLAGALLALGERIRARSELESVLTQRPGDRQARRLMESLEAAQ